jgi:hypothetical protein
VAILNRAAATIFWPGRDSIGRQVFLGDNPEIGDWVTVVGVVEDAERGELIERHWPMVYRPFAQAPVYPATFGLFIRMTNPQDEGAVAAAQAAIRRTGRAGAPLRSEESRVAERYLPSQVNALAFDVFAGFGLFLATIGIYASVAYGAARRGHEIGIRMALGATRWMVIGTLAGRQLSFAVGGVVTGIVGVLASTRVLNSFLLASRGVDPWLLVGSGFLSLGIVCIATCTPAVRATRTDAIVALRTEWRRLDSSDDAHLRRPC